MSGAEPYPSLQRGQTQARCWKCHIRWLWQRQAGNTLKDARCPGCGGKLKQTSIYCLDPVRLTSHDTVFGQVAS